jgi:hypothetical protein
MADLSPKVAAALSRRCLSEMLRDYWKVQHGSLNEEFRQIKGSVDPLTWEAIEAVRKIGSIGSRMEGRGAEILDTDPGEAALLITLIETLIQDWYVFREARLKRLEEMAGKLPVPPAGGEGREEGLRRELRENAKRIGELLAAAAPGERGLEERDRSWPGCGSTGSSGVGGGAIGASSRITATEAE